MWFILYFVCICFILFLHCRSDQYRRLLLIYLINMHKIHHIQWRHRGRTYSIILTSESVAKSSRNRRVGIHKTNGIIIKHFWLEGKLCNTDSFDMENLIFNRP
jgi:hypothetical protein